MKRLIILLFVVIMHAWVLNNTGIQFPHVTVQKHDHVIKTKSNAWHAMMDYHAFTTSRVGMNRIILSLNRISCAILNVIR